MVVEVNRRHYYSHHYQLMNPAMVRIGLHVFHCLPDDVASATITIVINSVYSNQAILVILLHTDLQSY